MHLWEASIPIIEISTTNCLSTQQSIKAAFTPISRSYARVRRKGTRSTISGSFPWSPTSAERTFFKKKQIVPIDFIRPHILSLMPKRKAPFLALLGVFSDSAACIEPEGIWPSLLYYSAFYRCQILIFFINSLHAPCEPSPRFLFLLRLLDSNHYLRVRLCNSWHATWIRFFSLWERALWDNSTMNFGWLERNVLAVVLELDSQHEIVIEGWGPFTNQSFRTGHHIFSSEEPMLLFRTDGFFCSAAAANALDYVSDCSPKSPRGQRG